MANAGDHEQPLDRTAPAARRVLPAASATVASRRLSEPIWRSHADEPLRIVPGSDSRACHELDKAFWSGRTLRVTSQSNRMGLRLAGEPIVISSPAERLSSPVAPGAVQLAGDQLIVLGVACGTMGGYPHIGHVISADLDRLGQLRPGDEITFYLVTIEEVACA